MRGVWFSGRRARRSAGRCRRVVGTFVVLLLAAVPLGACTAQPAPSSSGPRTISVPGDADTIQQAVDRARSGDVVLVEPGTYDESVAITTDGITLRGADRDGVVVDGGGLRPNGIVVTAGGVQVENLTVRDHTLNGVLVTGLTDETGGLARGSDGYTRLDPAEHPPLQGFAVRYVTASNNGLYGIYAFDAQDGVIEQSYASGHADSGIYVGQCLQCRIVVRDNVAELNAVGYEQANASAPLVVAGNRFTDNRVGAAILSDYQEAFVPQRGTTFVGNLVADNAEAATPEQADGAFGIGLALSGAQADEVARNRVEGNPLSGIHVASVEDVPPDDHVIIGNVLAGNGVDLADLSSERAPGAGSCAADNALTTTAPADLLDRWVCPEGGARAPGTTLAALSVPPVPPGISFREVRRPPAQPSRPADAPTGAHAPDVDTGAIGVPAADLLADRASG